MRRRRPQARTLTMGKHTDASTNQPLSQVRILVGRARHQAGSLAQQLRSLGAEVLEIPFIEIRKPKSFKPLDSALHNLHTYDWLILTSVNGVEAMWDRFEKVRPRINRPADHNAIAAFPAAGRLRVAAIGPATRKAIEQRRLVVDVVPKQYVAESVVRSLRAKVKGKRVLLVRAKVARDVIPRELRKAGALVDVVEAYETVIPELSRAKLEAALHSLKTRPHVVTFTSSSTVRNFVQLVGKNRRNLKGILTASIGPVTSETLRENRLSVDIAARQFTVPGLVDAIVKAVEKRRAHPAS